MQNLDKRHNKVHLGKPGRMTHQLYLKGAFSFDHRGNIVQPENISKIGEREIRSVSFDLEFQWMYGHECILLNYFFKD